MRKLSFACTLTLIAAAFGSSLGIAAEPAGVPPDKETVLGLYMTAREAYDAWKADPKRVKIVDVRTPEEYVFIGHPAMAWNVPLSFMTHQWDPARNQMVMKANPNFVDQVKRLLEPGDTLLVSCRSGQRSAPAVNLLAEAGLTNVYNVIDGFEGDKVRDPDSVFNGQRMRNGWRNSGLPWTYDLDGELVYRVPDER